MARVGIVAGFLALLLVGPAVGLEASLSPEANAAFLAANAKKPGVIVEVSGLQHRALHTGFGQRPKETDLVTVQYKGTMINGQVFDATEPGLPAQFTVNKLIPGWTEALKLMREGDEWELVIPSNLAYGARGMGPIPPGQTLVFDLSLLKVAPPPKAEEKGGGASSP